MRLALRLRIILTLIPMFLLLTAVGGAGIILLHRLSDQIDAILRENYYSVKYMDRLNESLERIDSAFNFALAGRDADARAQYDSNWESYLENLKRQQDNVTVPGEQELVARLVEVTDRYRRKGADFFNTARDEMKRKEDYEVPGGLFDLFKDLKKLTGEIRQLNQQNVELASAQARHTASYSETMLAIGLALAGALAVLMTWQMIRTILHPIRAVTEIARQISAGNLDQVMPVVTDDEVGQLAQAFNLMARHLRQYRQAQRNQLSRAQQTSQATIDSFPDAVLVIDGEGRVEMANPAARRLLGVTPLQAGQPASGLWQPPETLREPLSEALVNRRDYLPEGFEHTILMHSLNGECAILPRILTIRDQNDDALGAAVVLQDVTRLRLLDQVKNNLVATASHELKTPLTGIRLAIHLLLEESVGPLTAKQMELLLDARENSERLLAVVNNLLDLGKLEQGWRQLDARSESPRSLLRRAADAVSARTQDRNIEIQLDAADDLPAVSVDAVRIDHALRNLLDNAIVYTDRGGKITLSAVADGDGVALSVSDTGCGIPPEYLPHIFEKFIRVPGQSRGSGTGLGLAIVREIVTAHGGTITCESEPGVGTTFRLRLPVSTGDVPQSYVIGNATGPEEPFR